jgi:hypothetical protein
VSGGCRFPAHHEAPGSRLWLALAVLGGAALWAALALVLRVAGAVLLTLGVLSAAGVVLLCVLLWRDRGATWRPGAEPVEAQLARGLADRARLRQLGQARRALPGRAVVPGEVLARSAAPAEVERWSA